MKKAFYRFGIAMRVAFGVMWSCKWLFCIAPLIIALSLEAMQDANCLFQQKKEGSK